MNAFVPVIVAASLAALALILLLAGRPRKPGPLKRQVRLGRLEDAMGRADPPEDSSQEGKAS